MRTRSAWAGTTALITGLTLALPLTTTLGADAASSTKPSTAVAAAVMLPTGDLVRIDGTGLKAKVLVKPAAAKGIGRLLTQQRTKTDTYVVPADAQPYLGRILDRNLFDVTRLQAAKLANGRLPVRVSYSGIQPAVPGVTITSASGGVASGYLTAKSSREFGKALAAQWEADRKAGWPKHTSILGGVTKLTADVPGGTTVKPLFTMYTLVIKVKGADGKPVPYSDLGLVNVDDAAKYVAFPEVVDGEARVSVPAGTYSAIGSDFVEPTPDTFGVKIFTINEYKVTSAGQTLTLDYGAATKQLSVSTPKPADEVGAGAEWDRGDATGNGGLGWGFLVDSSNELAAAPAAAPKVGTVAFSRSWQLAGPGDTPGYSYSLAAVSPRIPADLATKFTSADLGTVNSSYYDDGHSGTGATSRAAYFPTSFGAFGTFLPVALGTRRPEYAGAQGGEATWFSSALINNDSFDDPGFVDAADATIPAGSTSSVAWFRGPLGAGIPQQRGDFAYCYACRTSKLLEISVAPFLDSSPDHSGEIFGAEDGLPVARFRFYKDGKLLEDKDDYLGDDIKVKTAKASYKAVFDVDRRLQQPNQSTQSHTELTFDSDGTTGGKLPDEWYCGAGDTADCRVLPVVQAKLALPTVLDGTLPAGKSKITVTVAGIQHATASAAKSATLEIRPAGWSWEPITLTSAGGGKYTGTIDNTDWAGSLVDVRLTAANAAGSTYSQTVLRAYTVAGS